VIADAFDVETQVEIDPEMTVRMLPLDRQGYPESYLIDGPTGPSSAVPMIPYIQTMPYGVIKRDDSDHYLSPEVEK